MYKFDTFAHIVCICDCMDVYAFELPLQFNRFSFAIKRFEGLKIRKKSHRMKRDVLKSLCKNWHMRWICRILLWRAYGFERVSELWSIAMEQRLRFWTWYQSSLLDIALLVNEIYLCTSVVNIFSNSVHVLKTTFLSQRLWLFRCVLCRFSIIVEYSFSACFLIPFIRLPSFSRSLYLFNFWTCFVFGPLWDRRYSRVVRTIEASLFHLSFVHVYVWVYVWVRVLSAVFSPFFKSYIRKSQTSNLWRQKGCF